MTTSPSGGYVAIAEVLRRQILAGAATLPSESELVATHHVARTTIRRALKMLEAEGFIRAQQGRAWVVPQEGTPQGLAFMAVARDLRRQIDCGELESGARVPSEKELARIYRCSRGTVRRALVDLESLGLIETRPGVGRFVVLIGSASSRQTTNSGEHVITLAEAQDLARQLLEGRVPRRWVASCARPSRLLRSSTTSAMRRRPSPLVSTCWMVPGTWLTSSAWNRSSAASSPTTRRLAGRLPNWVSRTSWRDSLLPRSCSKTRSRIAT